MPWVAASLLLVAQHSVVQGSFTSSADASADASASSSGGYSQAQAAASASASTRPTTLDAVPEYSASAKASAVAKVDVVTYSEASAYAETWGEFLPLAVPSCVFNLLSIGSSELCLLDECLLDEAHEAQYDESRLVCMLHGLGPAALDPAYLQFICLCCTWL